MFALRVRYLTGRVYAAEHDEGDVKRTVEWPPHPSRLFSALVCSWGEGGAESDLRPALEWLERQPSPTLYYAPLQQRTLVNVFVPVNDVESLPEDRPRKGRSFPSAHLTKPEVWFVWPDSLPDGLREPMERLLRRTPSLGHSASLVGIEIEGRPPEGLDKLEPGEGGAVVRLRVPGAGRLEALERSYERFKATGAKVHRPPRGRTAVYRGGGEAKGPEAMRGIFREMLVLRRISGEHCGLLATLPLTSALRGALMAKGPQPTPEVLSGHASGSSPERPVRSDRDHVAIVPLAFTGGRRATGDVGGLGILLPASLNAQEKAVALSAARKIDRLQMSFGNWIVGVSETEETRINLLPETWMRRSRTWATVTPYVFDRYPDDPYSEEARETVRRSFERVGLPKPASVSLMKTSVVAGVPPSPAFPAAFARAGKPQRFHMHVLVTFDELVGGPVVAGAGRYYGYGFFRPLEEEGRW